MMECMNVLCMKKKEEKYQILRDQFHDGKSFSVIPVVIGARGALPKETKLYFKKIAMPRGVQRNISFIALASSVEMVNCHLDYGG